MEETETLDALPDIQALLGLKAPPIAIGFFDGPPAGVPLWKGPSAPSGCSFWLRAQQGESFCTAASDHYNCPVGAYTHGISLPPERAGELMQTLQFMDANGYVSMDEVPGIPTLPQRPRYVAYAPADRAPFAPAVVVVAARPAQAMLLYEAALQSGASGALMNTSGRPACAILPLAVKTGSAALSLGCKGNRVYTGLPDEEMYVSVPGTQWAAVAARLERIVAANAVIGGYHEGRRQEFRAI
ncbi:MAG TPA: DUF169 domain-containing protein [Chthonomonadaceae bacterium]|nr:DUF169 domain-containing protein [Chthonomonadaceae bacterium]